MFRAMLARLAALLSGWSVRWIPDPLVIAVALSLLTFGLALATTDAGPLALVRAWGDGFWGLNEFAMQMCLVMVTGSILAASRPFARLLDALARRPRGPRGAIALMAAFSMGTALFHWGLSLIGSAVFARHLARRRPDVDYPLLIASAYLGMGVARRLLGPVPLLVATPGTSSPTRPRRSPDDPPPVQPGLASRRVAMLARGGDAPGGGQAKPAPPGRRPRWRARARRRRPRSPGGCVRSPLVPSFRWGSWLAVTLGQGRGSRSTS
jgi:hypothetical protein